MKRLRGEILLKAIMLTAVILQVVMALPHHHHEGSSAICLNPMHCLEAEEIELNEGIVTSEDMALRHGDSESEVCDFSLVEFREPTREQDSQMAAVIFYELDFELEYNKYIINHYFYSENSSRTKELIHKGVIPLHTIYMPKALPPRAPSA